MTNHLETEIGCNLLNTLNDKRMPSEFTEGYHVHIMVRKGSMTFSDGKNNFVSCVDDLVIWQMTNTIQNVKYSQDFEADFLLVSPEFLAAFNPEMVWASKGFVFIRINPSFHLAEESKRLMDDDFGLFHSRLSQPDSPFRREIVGRVMQIFLYDLWTVYRHGLSQMKAADNTAQVFLRFLGLVSEHVVREREVAFYADKLCITAKYLSQISNQITGLPASQWNAVPPKESKSSAGSPWVVATRRAKSFVTQLSTRLHRRTTKAQHRSSSAGISRKASRSSPARPIQPTSKKT